MQLPHIVTALVVVLSATAAHGQSAVTGSPSCDLPHASGVSSQQLVSGQRPRTYRLFVPPGYDGRQRLPLVLDLHGSGGNVGGAGQKQRTRDPEHQRAVHRGHARSGGRTLERAGAGQPGRRCRLRRRRDRSCRGACVHRRDARVCDRVLRRRTDVVVARVSARLAHRRHRAGLRAPISRSVHRPSGSGADLPRAWPTRRILTMDTPRVAARSGWRVFPTRSPAGRATTRARATRSSMTLRVRCQRCATTAVRRAPRSA